MPRPHKIDFESMADFFASTEVEAASATTCDETQRKRLLRRGAATYCVDRRYIQGTDIQWQPVYSGPDLCEAIRLYNGLG